MSRCANCEEGCDITGCTDCGEDYTDPCEYHRKHGHVPSADPYTDGIDCTTCCRICHPDKRAGGGRVSARLSNFELTLMGIDAARDRNAALMLVVGEVQDLRRWKSEATIVINQWEAVWHHAGEPGELGQSKAVGLTDYIDRLRAAIDTYLAEVDGTQRISPQKRRVALAALKEARG
jgi:hypothetical protein